MDVVLLARLQFAITTVYHFFFVPLTLGLSILVAIFVFKMPADMAFAAAGYGFAYGLWPIAWIIVAAVFLYKLTVKSGQFEDMEGPAHRILMDDDDPRIPGRKPDKPDKPDKPKNDK